MGVLYYLSFMPKKKGLPILYNKVSLLIIDSVTQLVKAIFISLCSQHKE